MIVPVPVPILYAHASSLVGGGNKVLLRLLSGLDRGRFEPVSVIPTTGPMQQELERLDVPYCIVDLRANRQSRPAQAVSLLRMSIQNMRWRPSLMHANELPYRSAALGAWSGRRICHIHHPGSTATGLRWMFRRVPDLIVTPTQFVRDEVIACLAECGLTVPVEVVLNPIDLDWFQPAQNVQSTRDKLGLNPAGPHISILGALTPHKGHECFLRLAQLVLRRHPQTTFHVVGSDMGRGDSYPNSLKQLASELGINDQVRFWGFVDDEVARDILAASDLFVLPSSEEGFGLVLAESQACGVPVLATAMRPLDEVVDDGRTGYLLPRDDHQAFADRATELLSDQAARQAMGEAGRTWVQARFSSLAHVNRMTSLYDNLLTTRTNSGTMRDRLPSETAG